MEWWEILLLVIGIIVVIFTILYFVGRKLQGKADNQQSIINQNKTTASILVIDKKKQKVKDSNLPKMVQDQIPKYIRFRKLPMVKAKIGPKITTLMCDDKVFKELPVKKMVKVDLAGIYIVGIKGYKK
ncbi:MAG: hypothetical protein N4A63_16805 [Vallitalea sp.]|jgi:hypothetical protein|nr:hypothetical protein [Vallitalea sp.]